MAYDDKITSENHTPNISGFKGISGNLVFNQAFLRQAYDEFCEEHANRQTAWQFLKFLQCYRFDEPKTKKVTHGKIGDGKR